MSRHQVISGQILAVPAKKWTIACCDCGLTHTLEFKGVKPKTGEILVKVTVKPGLTRDNRKTRAGKLKMVPK